MAPRLAFLLLVVGSFAACGKEIGDSCTQSLDCSQNGDRLCDPEPNSPGGYCTVFGCDYSTCPDEAVCVKFFTSSFSNRKCNNTAECENGVHEGAPPREYDGSLDEQCGISGFCVSRSSEFRYCMKTCSNNGDCRDKYECRDLDLMKAHGGEPVLAPGLTLDNKSPKFCAARL